MLLFFLIYLFLIYLSKWLQECTSHVTDKNNCDTSLYHPWNSYIWYMDVCMFTIFDSQHFSMICLILKYLEAIVSCHKKNCWLEERLRIWYKYVLNSHPVHWSEEKGKKDTKKSCKNYHGVADLGQICFKISNLNQQTARSPRSELEPLP